MYIIVNIHFISSIFFCIYFNSLFLNDIKDELNHQYLHQINEKKNMFSMEMISFIYV